MLEECRALWGKHEWVYIKLRTLQSLMLLCFSPMRTGSQAKSVFQNISAAHFPSSRALVPTLHTYIDLTCFCSLPFTWHLLILLTLLKCLSTCGNSRSVLGLRHLDRTMLYITVLVSVHGHKITLSGCTCITCPRLIHYTSSTVT